MDNRVKGNKRRFVMEYATKRPLQFYVDKIDNNEHFSMIRFGDGEWMNIFGENYMGEKIQKINKEMDYFEDARVKLRKTIEEPKESDNFFYAVQNLSIRQFGDKIPDYLDWHNCDVFHNASIKGQLYPLITSLNNKQVVFVGPEYVKLIENIIPYIYFVIIPERNCYQSKTRILSEILNFGVNKKDIVYSFSASIASNIFIYELHDALKDNWLIDFGSLWDPYTGRLTRGYHNSLIQNDDIYYRNIGKQNGCKGKP
jgi:hypothetical protein